jgi:hypothetical protein
LEEAIGCVTDGPPERKEHLVNAYKKRMVLRSHPGLAELQAALEEAGAECRGSVCQCLFHDSTDFVAHLYCERGVWVVACPVCGLPSMDVTFIRTLFAKPKRKGANMDTGLPTTAPKVHVKTQASACDARCPKNQWRINHA